MRISPPTDTLIQMLKEFDPDILSDIKITDSLIYVLWLLNDWSEWLRFPYLCTYWIYWLDYDPYKKLVSTSYFNDFKILLWVQSLAELRAKIVELSHIQQPRLTIYKSWWFMWDWIYPSIDLFFNQQWIATID